MSARVRPGDRHTGCVRRYARTIRYDGGNAFQLEIYPSKELYRRFVTPVPYYFVTGIVGSLLACCAVFAAYDLLTRRRIEGLMRKSAELKAQDALTKNRQTFLSMARSCERMLLVVAVAERVFVRRRLAPRLL